MLARRTGSSDCQDCCVVFLGKTLYSPKVSEQSDKVLGGGGEGKRLPAAFKHSIQRQNTLTIPEIPLAHMLCLLVTSVFMVACLNHAGKMILAKFFLQQNIKLGPNV